MRDKKVTILVQFAFAKHPELMDVPLVMDLAKNEADRQIMRLAFGNLEMARPFLAPPGIPEDRKAALVKAFDATMRDPAFLADAAKQRLEIAPAGGVQIDRFLADVYATPKPLIERAAKILAQGQ